MHKFLAILGTILLVACILWGCTATPRPSKCPPVKEYDEEFTAAFKMQLLARDERDQRIIPEGSPVAVYILDANQLRKQVRACQ